MAKKPRKLYHVSYFEPGAEPKFFVFERRPAAIKHIKDRFYALQDTGDRLRRVSIKPVIYALEPDCDNTGERVTEKNYPYFYHWILAEIG